MADQFAGSPRVTRLLRRLSGWYGFLPFYHTVSTEQRQVHLENLYRLRTVSEFEADLEVMLKYFEPVDSSVYLERMRAGTLRARPSMLLTFDDGLSEIYTHIEPILRSKGVPYVVFLNSAFVDNKGLFFRYFASLLVDSIRRASDSELLEISRLYDLSTSSESEVCSALLSTAYLDREKLDSVADIMEIDVTQFLRDVRPYLTTEQISELHTRGVEFGCHSVDHPVYRDLPVEQQLAQTRECATYVFTRWRAGIRSFAFPFTDAGVAREYFETVLSANELEVVFGGGSMRSDYREDIVHRTWMEGVRPNAERVLIREYLKCIARNLLGKGTMARQ